ncbi:hypothetical protein NDU88_004696 [Pleurodeles waltl]|uniref:Uncharacterized protein n=1 Tax=Pleurodeles waltl TaxID=8319 RepID=A0AAV7L106_PLEWA|nr:hypothetical protein NDU88_004696 [Pleurodeles waltl]
MRSPARGLWGGWYSPGRRGLQIGLLWATWKIVASASVRRCAHIRDGRQICESGVVAIAEGRAHGPCVAGGPSCLARGEESCAGGRGCSDGLLAAVGGSEARPGRASRAWRARRAWAARSPWPEEQAEPRAAGRSSSPGWTARRRLAANTPGERCGGKGFVPANAAASWEQRPGPSGVQPVVNRRRTVRTTAGELPRRAQEALGYGNELWREDCILDYDETSIEEGELVDDGEEEIWWEQGGEGVVDRLGNRPNLASPQNKRRLRKNTRGSSLQRKASEKALAPKRRSRSWRVEETGEQHFSCNLK